VVYPKQPTIVPLLRAHPIPAPLVPHLPQLHHSRRQRRRRLSRQRRPQHRVPNNNSKTAHQIYRLLRDNVCHIILYQFYSDSLYHVDMGIAAPAVTGPDSSGKYDVVGDNSFASLLSALGRSCDNQVCLLLPFRYRHCAKYLSQKNACANAANQQHLPVPPCDTQLHDCKTQTGSTNA